MATSLNWARAQLAAKIEGTEGTAESLTNAEAAIKCFDIDLDYDIPFVPDESVSSSLSPWAGIVSGPRMAKLTFKTWFHGSGTKDSAAKWMTLAKGCAITVTENTNVSTVLTPDDDQGSSLTLGWYVDGTFHQVHGSRGDLTITGKAANPFVCEWAFDGVYNEMTDVALLTGISYETPRPPAWCSASLTIDSVAVKLSDFTFKCNNKVSMVETPNTASGSYAAAILGKRHYTASANIMSTVLATKNWYTNWTGNTLQAISFSLGSATGNVFAWSMPKAQITKIKPENRNDMKRDALDFELIRNSGTDEWQITQT
jgi:hypothetical protein